MTQGMIRLRTMLDEHGIEWKDDSDKQSVALPDFFDVYIHRTKFSHKGKSYYVVHGYGTYGGFTI